MIIECTSCSSKYKYDESKFAGVASKKVRCPKCKNVIEVHNPQVAAQPKVTALDAFTSLERTYTTAPSDADPNRPPVIGANPEMDENGPRTAQVKRDSLMAEMAAAARQAEDDQMLKLPEFRRYSLA